MIEQWRDVVGYEGLYQVSDLGGLRNYHGVLLHPYISVKSGGYWLVVLYKNKAKKCGTLHRVVAEAFIGIRPKGMDILHYDGNPRNCASSNLRYGTRKENMDDARRHGTIARGETQGLSKLTSQDILNIRASTELQSTLATIYAVSQSNISRIKANKAWCHV